MVPFYIFQKHQKSKFSFWLFDVFRECKMGTVAIKELMRKTSVIVAHFANHQILFIGQSNVKSQLTIINNNFV